jgi:hypothetical protein
MPDILQKRTARMQPGSRVFSTRSIKLEALRSYTINYGRYSARAMVVGRSCDALRISGGQLAAVEPPCEPSTPRQPRCA